MWIYNTQTGKKEEFKSLQPSKVLMYCCGPTVYDLLHIGNFRGAVFYNFLKLWLEHLGYEVSFYYNLTDVDDKIIHKAKQEGISSEAVANKYIQEFFKDFNQLKLSPHTGNPKATEFISSMIHFIQQLVEKEKAYVKDGHVFYSVNSFKNYGKLSRKKLSDLQSGHRVEVIKSKKNSLDFTLWKPAKDHESGWDSPWGKGRPGWHTECVTMIHECLGAHIDIHGGGLDLLFPHHENEKAQAECLYDAPFVKYWVHHNMFEFGGQKISKSLGTLQTMRAFLKDYNGEIFKYLVFSSHYRSVSEISPNTIHQALAALFRVYQALNQAQKMIALSGSSDKNMIFPSKEKFIKILQQTRSQVEESLNDDLNTAKALGSCFSLIRFFNDSFYNKDIQKISEEDRECLSMFLNFFKEYGSLFSLFQEEPQEFLNELNNILIQKSSLSRKEIENKVTLRKKAREKKDFEQADRIREELKEKGVEIQDGLHFTDWNMNPVFFLDSDN